MKKIQNILLPTDFSEGSLDAARQALEFASTLGAKVHFFHVIEIESFAMMYGQSIASFEDIEGEIRKSAMTRMQNFMKELGQTEGAKVATAVETGNPAQAICEYASAEQIDLIMMSTHGRTGLPRLLLGSVTERVVRTASCPVLTYRYEAGKSKL